ncbi:hypothetical protein HDU79_011858 [Rhizoclosmatium sp. JEL0117]|nr:hypothetical protein HDU79_011858 [Rhizoclosmatium sp. JEL0117]
MVFGSYIPADQLQGLTVVVTGCDSGFGFETSLALVALGMNVISGCLTDKGIEELSSIATSNRYPGRLTALPLDVTNETSVSTFTTKATHLTPNGIFALINNAGIGYTNPFEILGLSNHRQIMEVNYFGTLRLMRAFSPSLRAFSLAQKSLPTRIYPRIINIGSVASEISLPMFSAYAASKHAVKALSDAARMEMSQFGIQVAVLEPFFARTPIVMVDRSEMQAAMFLGAGEEVREAYVQPSVKDRRKSLEKLDADWFTLQPEQVVNKIVDTVRRRTVGGNTLVGLMAHILVFLKTILPYWLMDQIFYANVKETGLSRHKYF